MQKRQTLTKTQKLGMNAKPLIFGLDKAVTYFKEKGQERGGAETAAFLLADTYILMFHEGVVHK